MIAHLFNERVTDTIIALLCAFMLIAIGIMHTQNHISSPVTIPSAIKMEWVVDSTWTGGWR